VSGFSRTEHFSRTKTRLATRTRRRGTIPAAIVILTSPLWLPLLLVVLVGRLIRVATLYAIVWLWWIGRARQRVLFVHSDSPHWRQHIETNILPKLPQDSVILNWSERARWRSFSVPVLLFHCFAGNKEFNPIGLVFPRFAMVERYRFWQPFQDAKHGRFDTLQQVESAFLERSQSRA
jgi:hypothetical protein